MEMEKDFIAPFCQEEDDEESFDEEDIEDEDME
jgi:hypothetical protein